MKLEQLKTKLSYIKKSSKRRYILGNVRVTSSGLQVTDLETNVLIKNNYELSEGLVELDKLGLIQSNNEKLEEYPDYSFDSSNTSEQVTVKIDDLMYCNKFSSSDETRLYLNSVAFIKNDMISINGHILKQYKLKNELEGEYLIPRTSVKVLDGLLKGFKIKGEITIKFNDSWAFIETDNFILSARLIKREYPKYQSIFPKKFEKSFKVTNMIELKTIKPLLNKRTKSVSIVGTNNQVTLKINNPEIGEHVGYLIGTCDHDFLIGFNMEYLEILSNGETTLDVKYNNELSPVLWNEAIVMPLKV